MSNILEFCLSPDLGGLELCVEEHFNYFQSKTNCKIVVAPGRKLDARIQSDDKYTIERNKLFPIFPAIKLAKLIDVYEIDIVHFHWTQDIVTVVLAKVLSNRKPKVIQSRHMRMTRFKDDFYHRWLYKNINLIHAVTDQIKDQLQKFIPQDISPEIKRVYLGTRENHVEAIRVEELKNQYSFEDNDFIIGIVGRIEELKGQHFIIEAISMLKNKNIKALIVGSFMNEKYKSLLEKKIDDAGLNERVIFTGFTKEVDEHMQLCDAMVLATTEETFGLVVIEAMVNKICMIATNKGGPLEIIDDKKNGLLFNRSADELKEAIELLYENEELKNKLALAGYEKVREVFDQDIQNEKLYQAIIGHE